jgi:pyridoxine 5-phosphate synthase
MILPPFSANASPMRAHLSVNLNKICLLRQSRGGDEPNVERAARIVIAAGAQGLTLHPRPDRRHATVEDCERLSRHQPQVELNIEGNPFAEPEPGYPGFIDICRRATPAQATLVPDARGQLTSNSGFDLNVDGERLEPLIAELRAIGCRVSLFMDAERSDQFERAAALGAQRVELYTGPYAEAVEAGNADASLEIFRNAARAAQRAGLGVNAGHDLNLDNLNAFAQIPGLLEVSIGHALVGAVSGA